jgi:hypothetical protein
MPDAVASRKRQLSPSQSIRRAGGLCNHVCIMPHAAPGAIPPAAIFQASRCRSFEAAACRAISSSLRSGSLFAA